MMQDFDRTMELVNISTNSYGATLAQHAKYMEGLGASVTLLTNAWQSLVNAFVDSDVFIFVLDKATTLLTYFADNIWITWTALGAFIVAAGISQVNAGKLAAKHYLAAVAAGDEAGAVASLTLALNSGTISTIAFSKATEGAATAHTKLIATIMANPYTYAFLAGIAVLGVIIAFYVNARNEARKFNKEMEETVEAVNKLEVSLYELRNTKSTVESLGDEFEELSNKVIKSSEDIDRMVSIAEQINDLAGKEVISVGDFSKFGDQYDIYLKSLQDKIKGTIEELGTTINSAGVRKVVTYKDTTPDIPSYAPGSYAGYKDTTSGIPSYAPGSYAGYPEQFESEDVRSIDYIKEEIAKLEGLSKRNEDQQKQLETYKSFLDGTLFSDSIRTLVNYTFEGEGYNANALNTITAMKNSSWAQDWESGGELTPEAIKDRFGGDFVEGLSAAYDEGSLSGFRDFYDTLEGVNKKALVKVSSLFEAIKQIPTELANKIDDNGHSLQRLNDLATTIKETAPEAGNAVRIAARILGNSSSGIEGFKKSLDFLSNAAEDFDQGLMNDLLETFNIKDITQITDSIQAFSSSAERLREATNFSDMSFEDQSELLADYPDLWGEISDGIIDTTTQYELLSERYASITSDIDDSIAAQQSILDKLGSEWTIDSDMTEEEWELAKSGAEAAIQQAEALKQLNKEQLIGAENIGFYNEALKATVKYRAMISQLDKEMRLYDVDDGEYWDMQAEKIDLVTSQIGALQSSLYGKDSLETQLEDILGDSYEDLIDHLEFVDGSVIIKNASRLSKSEKEILQMSMSQLEDYADGLGEVTDEILDMQVELQDIYKEMAEQYIELEQEQTDELIKVLEARLEAYEDYFEDVENLEAEDDYEEDRDSIISQLTALSGSVDSASLGKIKELREALTEVEEEELDRQRELQQAALVESIENQVESLEDHMEKLNDSVDQIVEMLKNGTLNISDVIASNSVSSPTLSYTQILSALAANDSIDWTSMADWYYTPPVNSTSSDISNNTSSVTINIDTLDLASDNPQDLVNQLMDVAFSNGIQTNNNTNA